MLLAVTDPDDDARVALAPLLREMERRRLGSLEGPNPIRQTTIAEQLGVSASTINRYASGERDLRKMTGADLYVFLTGYGFSRAEIMEAVEEHGLNYPPQIVNATGPVGMVRVLHEGSVTRPTAPVEREVPEAYLRGHKPELVRTRMVGRYDLATPKAAEKVEPNTLLVLHRDRVPRRGSIVVVEKDNLQALIVWPLMEATWATPYEAGGPDGPLLITPDDITVCGVAISGTTEYPH